MDTTKITLKNVEVVFANLVDEGFGKSITINATDKETNKLITDWVKANNIGKDTPGVPKFKKYEDKLQYSFKMNDNTRIAGINGLSQKDLGFGARISLVANSFEYDNKFGKGVSGSLSAVVVEKGSPTSADSDLAELLGDSPNTETTEDSEEISLSDIPF